MIYALWITPAVVVVSWAVWRVMVWCLFHAGLISARVNRLPAILRIPLAVGLLLLASPLLLLALCGSALGRMFPGFALKEGEVPRLFASSRSRALSHVFLSFLIFLPAVVPLRYLAYRLEGSQIGLWHWLLVFGPVPVLIAWLVARIWRTKQETFEAGTQER